MADSNPTHESSPSAGSAHVETSSSYPANSAPPSSSSASSSSSPSGAGTITQTQALYAIIVVLLLGSALLAGITWFSMQDIRDTLDQKSRSMYDSSSNRADTNSSLNSTQPPAPTPLPQINVQTRPAMGLASAGIVIYELADFASPESVHAYFVLSQAYAKYPDDVRIVFIPFLPTPTPANAQKAAEAAECANDQGQFLAYQKLLYTNQKLGVDDLKANAKTLGMDTAKFNTCLDTGANKPLIDAWIAFGQQNNIQTSPTVFVNGEPFDGIQSFELLNAQIQLILNPPRAVINISGRPVWGNASAPVTIIEFSDFQCPYCQTAYVTVQQVQAAYPGKIKLVYFQNPLNDLHPYAQKAAEASECANDQGKFWEYYDQIFTSHQLTLDQLKAQAVTLGMNATKFNACLDGGQKTATVSAQLAIGGANGVQGTPNFFINGIPLRGAYPFSDFAKIIDKELANAANTTKAS